MTPYLFFTPLLWSPSYAHSPSLSYLSLCPSSQRLIHTIPWTLLHEPLLGSLSWSHFQAHSPCLPHVPDQKGLISASISVFSNLLKLPLVFSCFMHAAHPNAALIFMRLRNFFRSLHHSTPLLAPNLSRILPLDIVQPSLLCGFMCMHECNVGSVFWSNTRINRGSCSCNSNSVSSGAYCDGGRWVVVVALVVLTKN